eukprot:jgi/Astpho2/2198/fgenesh1_pg.00040_%23_42_t
MVLHPGCPMLAGTESFTTRLQAPGLSGNGTGPGEEQPRPNHPGGPMDRDNRVPLLQLKREQSAMGEDSTMRHINKPPRLNLSGNSGIFNRSASSREPREAEAGVSIQLISNALSVEAATLRRGQELGIGRLEVLRQACSSKLGLAPAALKLFELREVPVGAELSADAAQIGVMVEGSVSQVDMACSKEQALPRRLQDAAAGRPYLTDFSLAAMEGIIGDLTRMTAERDRSAATVESLQQVLKNQNEQLARSNLQTGDQETELRRLQERCRQLDKEAVITRQQLQRSDQMRLEGQRALQDLKAEFDALTRDMSLQLPAQPLLEPTVSNASSMSRSFGAMQTMRTASASVQHSRLAGVLEK